MGLFLNSCLKFVNYFLFCLFVCFVLFCFVFLFVCYFFFNFLLYVLFSYSTVGLIHNFDKSLYRHYHASHFHFLIYLYLFIFVLFLLSIVHFICLHSF